MRHLFDVQPARGDVGGHQDLDGAVAEPVHDAVALLLHQPAVQGGGVVAASGQGLGELVDLQAGPGEDQDRGRRLNVEDAGQRRELVRPRGDVGDLPDQRPALGRGHVMDDGDPYRVAQVTRGDAGDPR